MAPGSWYSLTRDRPSCCWPGPATGTRVGASGVVDEALDASADLAEAVVGGWGGATLSIVSVLISCGVLGFASPLSLSCKGISSLSVEEDLCLIP